MTPERTYPDEPAGPFRTPPWTFTDADGREITLRAHDSPDESVREALVEMYLDFDPADRAQGIPPVEEPRVRSWVATLLGTDEGGERTDASGVAGGLATSSGDDDGYNVLAWHGDRVVGHATLVADGEGAYELAIFVHQEFQGAGIGSRLVEALLGHGADEGVEYVWLTVERWNRPAVHLYGKVGFETTNAQSFDLEMALRLDPDESVAAE